MWLDGKEAVIMENNTERVDDDKSNCEPAIAQCPAACRQDLF